MPGAVVDEVELRRSRRVGGRGHDLQQTPAQLAVGVVRVHLLLARAAFGVRPGLGAGVPGDGVLGAAARRGLVGLAVGIVEELDGLAIAHLQPHLAVAGAQRPDEFHAPLEAGHPAVVARVRHLAEAVVGAHHRDGQAPEIQELVAPLQHQVAVGHIDELPILSTPQARRPAVRGAQLGQRAVEQSQAISREDSHHVNRSLVDRKGALLAPTPLSIPGSENKFSGPPGICRGNVGGPQASTQANDLKGEKRA
ncbi:hypothetical protein NB717_003846 [Xanthomonas sacchari]|nr:hypothetical protein [Xanthomonas sacchari]